MYVYRIENLLTGLSYIGVTSCSLEKRWGEHKTSSKSSNPPYVIHKVMKKYGVENFSFQLLEETDSVEKLYELEIMYIKHYDSYKNGYNMTYGGKGSIGYKRTKPVSEETKEKLRRAMLGKKLSEETKEKLRQKLYGNQRAKGMTYSHSEEAKTAISEAHKGKKYSEETKARMSENRKGKSLGDKNAMANPEFRSKVSEAAKMRKKVVREDGTWYWGKKDSSVDFFVG